jgi:Icc-related predicted phosphoesterase
MKLGLVADIHEEVDYLREALGLLRHEAVDQVVFIGDLVGMAIRLEETCRLLAGNGR